MATGKYQVSRRFDCYDPSRRDYVRGSKNLTTCRDYEFKKNDGFYHSSSARKLESKHREHQLSDLQPPLEKKRKLCSSVWHGEDKEIKVSSKNRVIPVSVLNPSLSPSMPPLNGNSGGRVTNSFVSANQVDEFELPIANQPLEGDEHESSVVEDGEFIHERSISMSRWASDTDSPKHICASDDEEMPQKSSFSDGRGSSPESGEFLVGSSGHRSRSSWLTEVGQTNEICLDEFEDGDNDVSMDDDHTCSSNVNSDQDDMDECDLDHQELEEPLLPVCRSVCMLNSCRSVFDYEKLNKINEGTYGVVYRARDKKTGEIVALKKVKMNQRDADGGFPLTSLREINILLSLNHPSVVGVKEVVMGDLDDIYMVMEYMEHDLKGLMEMRKRPFSTSEVKCLMLQLLEGVKYLHDNWVLHRDLKTSNLLFNNKGELKICDFGLSRQYGSPSKPYTPLVVTMWYRAPELLLGAKQYSTAIDMWSVGCIMAEMLANEPLFKGNSEVNQLDKIFRTLGTPNEKIWPGLSQLPGSKANFVKQPYNLLRKKFPAASFTGITVLSESGFDLLNRLLTYDPEKRIMADEALTHEWFSEVPLPTCKDFMPTFPPLNAADRKLH